MSNKKENGMDYEGMMSRVVLNCQKSERQRDERVSEREVKIQRQQSGPSRDNQSDCAVSVIIFLMSYMREKRERERENEMMLKYPLRLRQHCLRPRRRPVFLLFSLHTITYSFVASF